MAKTEDPQRVSSLSTPQHPLSLPTRPAMALPLCPSMETFFIGRAEASPSPMTLVSNSFSDYHPDLEYKSFSQLLVGVRTLPMAANATRPHTSFFTKNNPNDGASLKEGGVATVVGDKDSWTSSRADNLGCVFRSLSATLTIE